MENKPYRVHVVVDPSYGERIRVLPTDEPVWVVDSAGNQSVIRSIWEERKDFDLPEGITSFLFDPAAGPEDWLIAELDPIDLHHGEDSRNPPYSILHVIGIPWSKRIQHAVSGFGFNQWEATLEGFTCTRDIVDHGR